MNAVNVYQATFRENETYLQSFSDGPKRDKGQLFFHVDLPDNPGAEDALAEKLWRALHDSFFNCQSDDPYYCFEDALKAVNEALDQEHKKRESGTIGRFHAVAALLQNEDLHFAQTGDAVVALKRGEYFSSSKEDHGSGSKNDSFDTISSAQLMSGDVVVFFTRPLPFEDQELLEVFSEKPSKIQGPLKALSKQKEITGLVSYWMYDEEKESAAVTVTPDQTSAQENNEVSSEEFEETEETESTGGRFDLIKSKFKGEQFSKARSAMKGVVGGVSSRLTHIVKKPDRIKNVNRRYILLAVVSLVVLLGILYIVNSNYREQAAQAQYYETLLTQVNMNIQKAEQEFLIGEKADANDLLSQAETALGEIAEAGYFQTDVEKIENTIALHRDNFDAIFRVSNPTVFADLTQKGTVDALGIINTVEQRNFIYEPRRLFETLLDTVQDPQEIDSEEIVVSGAELEDFNVLSFITQSGQVIEYEVRNGRFSSATTQDATWQKGVDVKTFNGEFIYILDPQSNAIWKYRRLRSGYSTASTYNSEGDLSNAVSLAIDGDIYVLNRDGSIVRFRSGDLVPYEVKSQPSVPLENPSRIFTLPEANNLYVLDSANSRVVVYSKDNSGNVDYQKQLIFETFDPNEIRDFYVDQDEQKLTVLTADKVYITDL